MRDYSIDIAKGIAILFVYLGHSIIYHPIELANMYEWCHILERFIASFNMPLFFIISGYLFSLSKKNTVQTCKDKFKRLVIPYLFTMLIVVTSKMILPAEMSYSSSAGMLFAMLKTWLVSGGDRWFVYVLFLVFLVAAPLRKCLSNKRIAGCMIVILVAVYFLRLLPTVFLLNDVGKFLIYFIVGYQLHNSYGKIKAFKTRWWGYFLFIVLNFALIETLCQIDWIFRFILPFTGTLAIIFCSIELESLGLDNKLVRWLSYLGKYSLQFYLFTFSYPIIRILIVSKCGIVNPMAIIIIVFVLQIISSTLIVEITRKIKWLKIYCGY